MKQTRCSYEMSEWIRSIEWDKEAPEAEGHFNAFVFEAKKDGLKIEFVIELIDSSVEESATERDKEELKQLFRRKAHAFFG